MENRLYEIISKYKCYVCDYMLSIPPIMIGTKKDGKEVYKCGRCAYIYRKNYHWVRNSLFEEMAQNLCFPCSYPPCTETLPWGEVEPHEGICHHKTITCPLSGDCKCLEGILVDQIGQHFNDKHKGSIKVTDTMVIDLERVNTYYSKIFIAQIENKYFFIYIDGWNRIAVVATTRSKYTRFNLKMKLHLHDDVSAFIENLPVIPYNNKLANIDSSYFMNDIQNDLTNLIAQKGASSKSYSVVFIADETIVKNPAQSKEEKDEIKEENILPQINIEAIRKALTCPYCMTYMAPPIFTCTTGHTICSACKSRLEKCPTCQGALDGPRIYTLEDMAGDVMVPCQFNINGCPFVDSASRIGFHECSFS